MRIRFMVEFPFPASISSQSDLLLIVSHAAPERSSSGPRHSFHC